MEGAQCWQSLVVLWRLWRYGGKKEGGMGVNEILVGRICTQAYWEMIEGREGFARFNSCDSCGDFLLFYFSSLTYTIVHIHAIIEKIYLNN